MFYRKLIAFAVIIISCLSINFTVYAETSGKVGQVDGNHYCTAKLSQSLLNQKGYKTATVKLKVTDAMGWGGGKVKMALRDGNGNWIGEWIMKNGDTIKLGNDHAVYRIYINKYFMPRTGNFLKDVKIDGDNFTNDGSTVNWQITNASNCSIS